MPSKTNRAVSEVVGAVILFGFLVISFSVYQGIVIPDQNRAVEFEHNQRIGESFQDLRNVIRGTAATGTEQSVAIRLAPNYPPRTFGLNLGGATGSLATEPLGALAIENVTAIDPEVRDHVGTTTTTLGPFETRALTYRPGYGHYTNAPTTRYENTLAYNAFPGGPNLTLTGQAVVDGRTISLVVLNGSFSEGTQGTVTVDTDAISTATRTVAVTDAGGPVTVTLPTHLPAANWSEILADELDTGGGDDRYVTAVTQAGPNAVTIAFEPGVTYELQLAMVGVGTATAETDAAYLTTAEGDRGSVVEGDTRRLVVETRDRLNNPVGNVSIEAAVTAGPGSLVEATAITGVDGRATFVYTAPPQVSARQDVTVEASFGGGATANRTATFDLSVLDVGAGVNPIGAGAVVLEDEAVDSDGCGAPPADCHVTLSLNNTDTATVNVTSARFVFYAVGGAPGPSRDTPAALVFEGTTLEHRGSFESTDKALLPGVTDVDLRVYADAAGTDAFDVRSGDFFIVTVQYDDGDSATYFVAPA